MITEAELNAARDRLLSLADQIEGMEHVREDTSHDSPQRADMFCIRFVVYNCGSPACIVGHYYDAFEDHDLTQDIGRIHIDRQPESNADWWDLHRSIVCPAGHDCYPEFVQYTPQKAAAMLRNFVKTGTVDWGIEDE